MDVEIGRDMCELLTVGGEECDRDTGFLPIHR